jgi:hypothetical protein
VGTSKGYKLPAGGNWKPLKKQANSFVSGSSDASPSASQLLRSYVHANGGASSFAKGGGPSGSGGAGGRAPARSTGKRFAKFLSDFSTGGLAFALSEVGLQDLIGKPAGDISAALLDALAGPASTLDQHAARQALNDVIDESLVGADTYEDVEAALARVIAEADLFRILAKFFGAYLYRRFCRDFYESWVAKVGAGEAALKLQAIKDCIESAVKSKLAGREIKGVEWGKAEGTRLSEEVLRDVLDIFGVIS